MPARPRPIRAWNLPATAPPPTGQAAALEAALDRELVRQLGAVPLVLPLLEQLDFRAVVNRRVHPQGTQTTALDLGTVLQVLVLNRLLAPKPLVHVETWLAETVLPDLLGLDAAQCNDDRLARALDAVHPHLDALWQDLIVAAIRAFDLDLSHLGYDITSLSFCGAYDDADLIMYGYSRDHRPDRQQLELATTTLIAGGVPLDYHVLAGNVADRTTPVANLARLQRLLAALPRRDATAASEASPPPGEPSIARRAPTGPLVISDRAMLTLEALAAYQQSDLRVLGPLDPSLGDGAVRTLLASVPAAELAAAELAYRPQRAAHDPDWVAYQGVRRELVLPHPQAGQPSLTVQALVVWSPGKARVDAQLRTSHLTRLETALQDLAGKLGRRPYTTVAAVERRVATLLRRHPARRFLVVRVGESDPAHVPAPGITLTWDRDAVALAAAAAVDGRYVLGTTAGELDAEAMLARSKWRDVPEKRYEVLKGPLAIRPVYLHQQPRILGLVFCTMVALLLFALLELLARRAGVAVSGPALLAACAPLGVLVLVFTDGSRLCRLMGLTPPLATVLAALGGSRLEPFVTAHT